MAVSKSTPTSPASTRQHIDRLFRKSQVSADRLQEWKSATKHLDHGDHTLRFPIYEHLYNFNLCAQQMVTLLRVIDGSLNEPEQEAFLYQCVIQKIRANFTSAILDQMSDVERLDSWIFESLCRSQEAELTDSDEMYLRIRELEAERLKNGKKPRVQFLDEKPVADKSKSKKSPQNGEAQVRHE